MKDWAAIEMLYRWKRCPLGSHYITPMGPEDSVTGVENSVLPSQPNLFWGSRPHQNSCSVPRSLGHWHDSKIRCNSSEHGVLQFTSSDSRVERAEVLIKSNSHSKCYVYQMLFMPCSNKFTWFCPMLSEVCLPLTGMPIKSLTLCMCMEAHHLWWPDNVY